MLKRQVLTLGLIFSFFISTNVLASTPLSCDQLTQTSWVDASEAGFGPITLRIGFFYDYYLAYYTDGMSFDEEGEIGCDVQPDGSLLITNAGSLLLQTSDLQTLTVLPPSSVDDSNRRPVAIHGPFTRA